MAVLYADGNTEDRGGTNVTGGTRWNRSYKATVGEATSANLDRLEQAWESAARADGVHQIALSENHRFARSEVGSHHGERYAEIFKLARVEDTFDEVREALIACQAEAGDAPPGNIAKTKSAASFDDARKRRAAGVGSSQDTAYAGPGDVRDGDVVLLKHLQNAEMRKATRETSAKR
jgi:hypothetical protein